MSGTRHVGPDLVIAGSARSGTSFLASLLASHPHVDACAVKEPNYFSREHARGPEWYDGLFGPRRQDLLRLDASMSYTFGHFPDALDLLAEEAPHAFVVYSVRHPVARLLSHFQLHRDYFRNDPARTLGEALDGARDYRSASDYGAWLPRLEKLFAPGRLLVVPFPVVTQQTDELVDVLCRATGLDPEPLHGSRDQGTGHRNQVVALRGRGVLHARRLVRRWGLYPAVRRALGPDRLRQVRAWLTRPVETESLSEALVSCRPEQREQLAELYVSAGEAVVDLLARQDARLGLDWSAAWSHECPLPGEQGVDW